MTSFPFLLKGFCLAKECTSFLVWLEYNGKHAGSCRSSCGSTKGPSFLLRLEVPECMQRVAEVVAAVQYAQLSMFAGKQAESVQDLVDMVVAVHCSSFLLQPESSRKHAGCC